MPTHHWLIIDIVQKNKQCQYKLEVVLFCLFLTMTLYRLFKPVKVVLGPTDSYSSWHELLYIGDVDLTLSPLVYWVQCRPSNSTGMLHVMQW